jgi:hypothetical protein
MGLSHLQFTKECKLPAIQRMKMEASVDERARIADAMGMNVIAADEVQTGPPPFRRG